MNVCETWPDQTFLSFPIDLHPSFWPRQELDIKRRQIQKLAAVSESQTDLQEWAKWTFQNVRNSRHQGGIRYAFSVLYCPEDTLFWKSTGPKQQIKGFKDVIWPRYYYCCPWQKRIAYLNVSLTSWGNHGLICTRLQLWGEPRENCLVLWHKRRELE